MKAASTSTSRPTSRPIPHPPFAVAGSAGGCSAEPGAESAELPTGPTGKARADGARTTFLRGATAMQELIEPMITGEPYPIKALIVYGTNLLNTIPNVAAHAGGAQEARPGRRHRRAAAGARGVGRLCAARSHVPGTLRRADRPWRTRRPLSPCASPPSSRSTTPSRAGGWHANWVCGVGLESYFKWETVEEYLDTRLMSIGSSVRQDARGAGSYRPEGQALPGGLSARPRPLAPSRGRSSSIPLSLALAGHRPTAQSMTPVEEPPQGLLPAALRPSPRPHLCQDAEHAVAQRAVPGE